MVERYSRLGGNFCFDFQGSRYVGRIPFSFVSPVSTSVILCELMTVKVSSSVLIFMLPKIFISDQMAFV